ncbi:MAG: tyrosine-type recombinase/integrase [Macromonas sp.]
MATTAPTSNRVRLTAGRVESFACQPGKPQSFLWDTEAPSLQVRVTPTGRKTYAFESRLHGKTLRVPIGTTREWALGDARKRANELKQLVDNGQDPREVQRQQQQAQEASKRQKAVEATTVGQVWAEYLEDRRPIWGDRHYADHLKMADAGGKPAKRGKATGKDGAAPATLPGPVHALLGLKLKELTSGVIEAWAVEQAKTRPTYARLCWRCLKVFLGWCAEHPRYAGAVPSENPAKTKKTREALGKPVAKTDALLKEQLPAWFGAVQQIENPTVSAYLLVLLLTGARPGEVLGLKWEDVNTQWRGLTIRDKVEGQREIPLTPYVHHLIAALPRRGEYVFASSRTDGPIATPTKLHTAACQVAGVDVTLHGLRRSFGSLSEWLEIPAGVAAQIMGHKPSATAEKHYRVRPLDLLRVHHERIEGWILEQAGVQFDRNATPGKLALVA